MGTVGKWFGFGKNENYDEAIRAFEAGEFENAIEQFKICLASDPDVSTRERAKSYMAGALGKLARREVSKDEWGAALHFLDDAVFLRPGFADLRMLRAQVFDALKRREDRIFEIRFSLDLNPKYGFAVLHDGINKYEDGDYDSGVERMREAVGYDSRMKTEVFDAAMSLHESGSHDAALAKFKEVVPVQKTDPEEIARNADKLAHKGRFRDADEAYRTAIEIAPHFADVRCKHGQVLLNLDEIEQAIAEFREAVSINERYADGYAYLGVALRRLEHEDQAMDAFRAALQIDPAHVVAQAEIERTP